jgi:hypothetical protein
MNSDACRCVGSSECSGTQKERHATPYMLGR